MKYTKKLIMIPEVKYITLLNMIKGEKPLAVEKAQTDTKIGDILRNTKLSEHVKGKKYDWLLKQSRHLKNEIRKEAEKPQNVILDSDQIKAIEKAATPRYMGVELTEPRPGTSRQRVKKPILKKLPIVHTEQSASDEDDYDTSVEEQSRPPKDYHIHPSNKNDIVKILKQNATKYGINKQGGLDGIPMSNFRTILNYLTGDEINRPKGTDQLLGLVKNDKWYKKAIEWADYYRQRGEGRRKNNRVKPQHQKLSKPTLWARL